MFLNETGIHIMDSFEFEYGRILENVAVEYMTYGNPKYDDGGYITNAVIFMPTFRGIYSFLNRAHGRIVKKGGFDKDFYIIFIHSLGTPESCSPSSTGLNYEFPMYTSRDGLNFKRQFLAEKFKIKKLLGLIGEGIGGFQTLTWACDYPDEMDFVLLVNTAAKISGYRFIMGKIIENIIDSVEGIDSNEYSISKNKAIVAINTLLFAHSASKYAFDKLDNDQITALYEDFAEECFFRDIYDVKFRNDCDMEFDVEDRLSNIKAKLLYISTNSNYFDADLDAVPFEKSVKDSTIVILDETKEEYYFEEKDYTEVIDEIVSFLKQFIK